MTAKLKRLRPGQLDCLVLDYMKVHREGPLTATSIAKGLGGRSAGAVANWPYAPGRRRQGPPGQTNSSSLRPQVEGTTR